MAGDAWGRIRRESPFLRKATSLLKQLPRFRRRLWPAGAPHYSVFANSIPKSGTHLLVQVLESLPGIVNYDAFIASTPPVRFRARSRRTLLRRIGWISRGELASGHLYYEPMFHDALRARGAVLYFVYRDPRDVVISEALYLTYMNRWHRAHRYFSGRLNTDEERILCSIRGIPSGEVDYSFPDITTRYRPYLPWRAREDVHAVRFEDLVSERRQAALYGIARFFQARTGHSGDTGQLVASMERNINPKRSRTFRSGVAGGWSDVFTDSHRAAMKETAGDLLLELGYEEGMNW